MGEVIRGRFKQAHPPEPAAAPKGRQAKAEEAHGSELALRMSMWLVHAEKYVGLGATRAMLLTAIQWVDGRMIYKGKKR